MQDRMPSIFRDKQGFIYLIKYENRCWDRIYLKSIIYLILKCFKTKLFIFQRTGDTFWDGCIKLPDTLMCNPPYGKPIGLWMEKAWKSSVMGAFVVCLVPARTDPKWWNTWVLKGEIEYLQGRLKFGDSKNNAPFASALITYRPPLSPQFGIFPEFDLINEINLWGEDRIPMMAPWLLPHLL